MDTLTLIDLLGGLAVAAWYFWFLAMERRRLLEGLRHDTEIGTAVQPEDEFKRRVGIGTSVGIVAAAGGGILVGSVSANGTMALPDALCLFAFALIVALPVGRLVATQWLSILIDSGALEVARRSGEASGHVRSSSGWLLLIVASAIAVLALVAAYALGLLGR